MSLESAFVWLGETPPGRFLAESTPAFAVVQSLHILSFGILGGAILALDLAALRVIFRAAPLAQVGRLLAPVFVTSLSSAAVTGVLLVAAGPMKYYTNPIFPLKLGALTIALIVHAAIYPGFVRGGSEERESAIGPALGVASLVLWFGVAILGRWIGLI